jgi:hypothetical protein
LPIALVKLLCVARFLVQMTVNTAIMFPPPPSLFITVHLRREYQ